MKRNSVWARVFVGNPRQVLNRHFEDLLNAPVFNQGTNDDDMGNAVGTVESVTISNDGVTVFVDLHSDKQFAWTYYTLALFDPDDPDGEKPNAVPVEGLSGKFSHVILLVNHEKLHEFNHLDEEIEDEQQ